MDEWWACLDQNSAMITNVMPGRGGMAARAMNCGQAKPGTTTCYYDYKYQTCYAYSCSHWLSEEGRGRKAIRSHPEAQPNKPAS